MSSDLWLPEGLHWDLHIERHPLPGGTGSMTGGGNKMVLHTAESPREWIDGAISQFTAGSGTPHLSIGWRKGTALPVLAQFLPFDEYAKTLEHPAGTPETNRANAVQIEICGRAAESNGWDDNYYRAIANALLLTSHRVDFPIKRPRTFPGSRYTESGWVQAEGIVGHCHCPNNSHTDPGRFDGRKLIRLMNDGKQQVQPR